MTRDIQGNVTSGDDHLEYPRDVDAPGDLADEDGSQSLGAQLLVHAQEVDLHQRLLLVIDSINRIPPLFCRLIVAYHLTLCVRALRI